MGDDARMKRRDEGTRGIGGEEEKKKGVGRRGGTVQEINEVRGR